MARFELPDGFLAVEDFPGPGAPVVLLHGVLASSDAWRPVATRLHAAGRRLVLVDDRGHGRASPPGPGLDWGPRGAAADLEAYLRAAHPDGAHLVGHSRGAIVAAWVAAEAPELAQSLAVVCSPPQPTQTFLAAQRRLLAALPSDAPSAHREALEQMTRLTDDDFPMHALRRYRNPALVVEVGDDPLYSPTDTLFWRMFLPYASFERLDEGGHAFFARRAGEDWLVDRLLRFLAEGK